MASTYSDFDFYSAQYGGRLDAEAWRVFAERARDAIDYLTFGRAASYLAGDSTGGGGCDDGMRRRLASCECELVDTLNGFAALPVGVTSVNNDGYSQDFGGAEENQLVWQTCRKYLTMPVNLMLNGAAI